jgi:hypothetical protein
MLQEEADVEDGPAGPPAKAGLNPVYSRPARANVVLAKKPPMYSSSLNYQTAPRRGCLYI